MFDIEHGVRGGANVALMQGAVAKLTDEDILNLQPIWPRSSRREHPVGAADSVQVFLLGPSGSTRDLES